MFKFELIKLIRNNIMALIIGYVIMMAVGVNVLHLFFSDANWVNEWGPKITIIYIVILIDLLFWMAGMQMAEDFETNMIQVMRTSRSVFHYFFHKHLLLITFIFFATILVLFPNINSPIFIMKFLYLTLLLAFLMIASGVLITMVVKKQSVLMIAGSLVTGLVFIALVRLVFPTWIIEAVSINPFEYFISAYYNLYLSSWDLVETPFLFLTIFTVVFYGFSIFLFKVLTYKKGFRL